MNLLIRSLSSSDRALIEPYLVVNPVFSGQTLMRSGEPVRSILFPESVTITLSPAQFLAPGVAIGVVGQEGALGWSALLGSRYAPFDATVLPGGGAARTIPLDRFLAACAASLTLTATMLRFAQAMADQLASSATCGLIDPVPRRLARWLLMLHDRSDSDELTLTHDMLAEHLGTRRASVTDSLHLLEGEHVVRCVRGRIVIRDRDALEAAAGASYGAAETKYRSLIGPFGRSRDMTMRVLTGVA